MSQPDPTTVAHPTTSTPPADAVSSPPSILVLGGTGLMGREVLGALRRRGARARVLVRDAARLATLEGVDVHVGDLRDPASLRRAMHGVDVVFHISPHEADEVELTRTVVVACEEQGARLVFAGVHVTGRNPLVAWLVRRFYGLVLPRYRGKFAIGRMVESSATNPVILCPSNFMQNDEVLLDVIRAGEFVHPCHPKGLNRVDLAQTSGRPRPASCSTRARRRAPTRWSARATSPARSAPRCGLTPWAGRCATRATTTRRSRRRWRRTSPVATATTTGSPRCASCAASRCT